MLRKGEEIGKYIILDSLGSGGEGSVFLAAHSQTHQLRALKELPRSAGRTSYHEVRVLRRMHHKSLPDIIDVLETERAVILVMEYVRGKSLEQILLRRNRLGLQQTLDAGVQMGEALRYLHGRTPPVLHLDIKPANLICRPDGTLVLVDFGASLRERDSKEENLYRGTDGYAAPEMYEAGGKIDERTDIYGVAAVMYRMISGLSYSPVLHKGRVPGCPDALSDVIRRALSPDPDDRYESAEEWLQALRKIIRRKKGERRRLHGYAAALLTIFCGALGTHALSQQMHQEQEEWDYGKLVGEAAVVSAEESEILLRKAIFLEPAAPDAYRELLHLYGADSIFTEEEDLRLRELLHTVPPGQTLTYEELLQQNGEAYGEICSRLGFMYRCIYKEEDGRRIAGGWFEKALGTVDAAHAAGLPSWYESASIYARLCGSRMSETGWIETEQTRMEEAWEDLKALAEQCRRDYLKNGEVQVCMDSLGWICEEALAAAMYLPKETRDEELRLMTELLREGIGELEGAVSPDTLSIPEEKASLLADLVEEGAGRQKTRGGKTE